MNEKLLELYRKHETLILYAIYGILTTFVNLVAYFVCTKMFCIPIMASSLIAWAAGVIFAYVTNRLFVFKSNVEGKKEILKELISFTFARTMSEVLELLILYVFVTTLAYSDVVWKVVASIVVIVFNYAASKLVVFKKR